MYHGIRGSSTQKTEKLTHRSLICYNRSKFTGKEGENMELKLIRATVGKTIPINDRMTLVVYEKD